MKDRFISLDAFISVVLLLVIFLTEWFLFKTYIQREIAWSPFLNGDANWYLSQTYVFFDSLLKTRTVPPGFWEAPHGIMMFFATSLLYLIFGTSRVICLSGNFISFILWQAFVFFAVRRVTKSWSFAFSILGLCMAIGLPFQINKPNPLLNIQEYQREFVVTFIFGIVIVAALFSDTFLKRTWALIVGLIAGLMVSFRYIMLYHMMGIYTFIIVFFFVMFMLMKKRKPERAAEYKRRAVNSGLSYMSMGAACCYFIYRARVILFQHTFVGTLIGKKDEMLIKFYRQGGGEFLQGVSYYLKCIMRQFLAENFMIASLALSILMGVFIIASLILLKKKMHLRGFNPVKILRAHKGYSWLNYNRFCFYIFLIACAIIPLLLLTIYPLRGGMMASLITVPCVLIVAFIFIRLFNRFNIVGEKPLLTTRILLAITTLSIGLFHQIDSYALVSLSSHNRADYLEVARMYDDIVRLSKEAHIKEPGISVNFVENYTLGCCEAITAYWYEHHSELFRVRALLGGDIASPVEEEEAINTIKGSNIVLLSVHETPVTNIDPLKFDTLSPILAKYPFAESMLSMRHNLENYVKANFIRKGCYQIFNRTVELYVNSNINYRPISIRASSQASDMYSADMILEASSPVWHSEGTPSYPQWLEFEYKEPVVINNITIQCQVGAPARAPSEFYFQGRDINGNWVDLLEVSNADFKDGDELKSWPVENVNAFTCYRLYITKNNGASQVLTIKQISFGYAGNKEM